VVGWWCGSEVVCIEERSNRETESVELLSWIKTACPNHVLTCLGEKRERLDEEL